MLTRRQLKDGQCFVYCYDENTWTGQSRYVIGYDDHCKTRIGDSEQYERSVTNSGWSPDQEVRLIPHWLEPHLTFSDLVAGDCFVYLGYSMSHILVNASGDNNPDTSSKPHDWAVSYKYVIKYMSRGPDTVTDKTRVVRIPHWSQSKLVVPHKDAQEWGPSPIGDIVRHNSKLMPKHVIGNYIDGLPSAVCLEYYTLNMRDDGVRHPLTKDQTVVAKWMWDDRLRELNKKSADKDRMQVVVDLDWE